MQPMVGVTLIRMWAASLALADDAGTQISIGETLSGPDSHETGQGPNGHLLGDWGGLRSDLFERGVRFDFQYISDNLANMRAIG
jgi:porin